MKSSTEAPAVLGPVERLVRPHATAIRYATIVADPPWKYGSWGRGSAKSRYAKADFNAAKPMPYQTMTVDEIKALPVAALAADNCDLYLWTTQKYLPDSFEVLKAWGFRYCQTLTWCKAPMGTGQGGLFCPTTEFCLLGRKGKMPAKPRVDTTWWNWPRAWKTHSRKPEKFQDVVEGSSDAPRLELFARRERHGWHTWGNEVPCDVFMGPNTVLQAPKGVRVVATAAGVFAGATFLAAISAAMSAQAAEPSTQEQKQ